MKKLLFILIFNLIVVGASFGQGCSVCTKTTAGFDDKSARGINGGIVYLAFLPLGIMGTLGFIWWKHNKVS